MLGEELTRDAFLRRLVRERFGAILAELEELSTIGIAPGAALTIESIALVDLMERLRGAQRSHLGQAELERLQDGRNPGRRRVGSADARAGDLCRVLGAVRERVVGRVQEGSRFAPA